MPGQRITSTKKNQSFQRGWGGGEFTRSSEAKGFGKSSQTLAVDIKQRK